MPAYLTQGWLDLLGGLARGLPERTGVNARVQHVVTGTPVGEVRYVQAWSAGRLVETRLGSDPSAEVTFLQTHADAQQVAKGEVGAEVTFMQGRLKVTGDMGAVMALMPVLTSEEYRTVLAAVSELTEY